MAERVNTAAVMERAWELVGRQPEIAAFRLGRMLWPGLGDNQVVMRMNNLLLAMEEGGYLLAEDGGRLSQGEKGRVEVGRGRPHWEATYRRGLRDLIRRLG